MLDGCTSMISMPKQHNTISMVSYEGRSVLESIRDGSGMYQSRKKCLSCIEQDQQWHRGPVLGGACAYGTFGTSRSALKYIIAM